MSNMQNKIHELYSLERLSAGDTTVHIRNPMVKLLAAFVFIITVVSFDRYSFVRLIPFVFYPAILMALSETPYSMLSKRLLVVLPFCLFAGVSNVIFDREAALTIGGFTVSYGVLSLVTLLFRAYLCVMAVLILVATTPVWELSAQLLRLRVPGIFVTVLEMTYRYIGVLLEEAHRMYTAYKLRSASKKGLEMRHMGSFVGNLTIRSFDRAERVYNAMKLRGYSPQSRFRGGAPFNSGDAVYIVSVCAFCVLFRLVSLDDIIGLFGVLR